MTVAISGSNDVPVPKFDGCRPRRARMLVRRLIYVR